jgi:hypothetical protein
MSYARFNPEEAAPLACDCATAATSDAVIDVLLDTPAVAVPTEAIIPAAAVEAVVEEIFAPYDATLLEKLSAKSSGRIGKLESVLARLGAATDLGPQQLALQAKLLRIHERIGDKLEARLARREQRKGKGRSAIARGMRLLRARRNVVKAQKAVRKEAQGGGPDKQAKADKVTQIRQAYQDGKISRGHASYLAKATLAGKRPSEAKQIAIDAGGIGQVDYVQKRLEAGASKDFSNRLKSHYGRF